MLTTEEYFDAMQLKWLSGIKSLRNISSADVSIVRVYHKHSGKYRYCFTFRNGVAQKLGERVDFAVAQNRLYIKPCTETGVKLNSLGKQHNKYTQLLETTPRVVLKAFIGNYELQYDQHNDLYYVERFLIKEN